jgi:hypothetical protein
MIYWRVGNDVENEGFIDPINGYLTPAGTNLNALLFLGLLFVVCIQSVSIPAIYSTNRLYFREVVIYLYIILILYMNFS